MASLTRLDGLYVGFHALLSIEIIQGFKVCVVNVRTWEKQSRSLYQVVLHKFTKTDIDAINSHVDRAESTIALTFEIQLDWVLRRIVNPSNQAFTVSRDGGMVALIDLALIRLLCCSLERVHDESPLN